MFPTRDFTVAVFVVRAERILLHWHSRLGRWLPPGGHIEPHEIPDEAARREVLEETGVEIELIGSPLNAATGTGNPRQLVRPVGIQLADIGGPQHQHIDLVYFARGLSEGDPRGSWLDRGALDGLDLSEEVRNWCLLALDQVQD